LNADDVRGQRFSARLAPFEEVPSISSAARGEFRLRLNDNGTLTYTLSYRNLESDATQAHIHFGDEDVNGGISIWLCSNLTNPPTPPPPNTPACPLRSGTVSDTVDADDVVGPAGQGIDAGELEELLRGLDRGFTYANVHSMRFGGGEIRGQIRRGSDRDD
jgi:hypothetical protein